MKKLFAIYKDWALPISIMTGIILYLVYHFSPSLYPYGHNLKIFCETAQPVLIFMMLFCQFNKVSPKQIRLRRWHLYLLLFQTIVFSSLALAIMKMEDSTLKILIETFMVCIICPTATASGVIADKLGGDLAGIITYVLLINLVFAFLFPLMVPLIHPAEGLAFWAFFYKIVRRMFPTLIMPCITAWIIRWLCPPLQRWLASFANLAFWLWTVALTICLVLTTRIIVLSRMSVISLFLIGAVAALACAIQFGLGRKIGSKMGKVEKITAAQALGQKNTALMIWACYAFLSPQTAVGGGFYSIWHNIVNSRQLARKNHESEVENNSHS